MKRAPETLIIKHAADPRSRTSSTPATSTRTSSTPATSTRTSSTPTTSTRTSSTPAKKERPRIKGWGRKPSDVDAGAGDERSRRTLHALERTADLSRVAQSRSLEPAEVEELAGLVAILLTCQECDAPALFRRCAAHR